MLLLQLAYSELSSSTTETSKSPCWWEFHGADSFIHHVGSVTGSESDLLSSFNRHERFLTLDGDNPTVADHQARDCDNCCGRS